MFRYDMSSDPVAGRRETVRRRVVRTESFVQSVAALNDSAESRLVLETLILRATRWPHTGALVEGTAARVLRSLPYGHFPAVRLVYRVAGDVVYLYRADYYDMLQAVPRGYA